MVTRYSSISTRKLTNALRILTCDKSIVAISDYDDFHKMVKRHVLTSVLGPNAQKRHRMHRDTLIENVSKQLQDFVREYPNEAVNLRKIFQSELFGLALKQALGKDIESIYIEELGAILPREDLLKTLVLDIMEGAIDVDWRDFFPYLKWIPNKSFENRIQQKHLRREAVMKALIKEQRKRIESGETMPFKEFFTEYGEAHQYDIQEVVGKGSYGVVAAAVDTHTGEKVAIKKINNVFEHVSEATRILREIKLLRLLRHPDIVEIKHILLPPCPREFRDIYVVFELMECDLQNVIKANDNLTSEHYQFFLYQLLRGLKYMHTANVFHRDLKPKNILANADCKLKI